MLSLLGGGVGAALTAGLLRRRAAPSANAPDYLVLIVLDGARPEYLSTPGTPNLQSLLRNGTQFTNAFAGILESETPPGHVSIATGCEPRSNGIVNFWWGSPDNQTISLFSPDKINAGDMEAIIRDSGVPTIAGQVHRFRSGSKVVALSGSKYYASDALGGPDSDVTMYFYGTEGGMFVPTAVPGHEPPLGILDSPGLSISNSNVPEGVENHLAMKLAIDTFTVMRQHVTLINLPEFDWPLGHVHGGIIAPDRVRLLMQGFDQDLGRLQDAYRRAGVLDRTIFVITADHGMMPLRATIDSQVIDKAVTSAGTSIRTSSYNSGAAYWLDDPTRAADAARNLAALRSPLIQAVYAAGGPAANYAYFRVSDPSAQHTPRVERANQNLLRTFAGPNGPDVMALFAEGVGCEPGGQASWKGDHGGASWEAQHMPLLIAGPGVNSGAVSDFPARLIDLAPTALSLMGIPSTGMQGIVLADALHQPSSAARRIQDSRRAQIMPVTHALADESRIELTAGA